MTFRSEPPRIVLAQHHPETDLPGMFVRTAYSEEFVEELKKLPRRDRRWVPNEEVWWVAEEHVDLVKESVQRHYGEIEIVDEHGVVEHLTKDGTYRQEGLF